MIRLSLLILFAFVLSAPAFAANTPRHVHLEWDADSEASTYEIEIGHQGTKKLAVRRAGLKTSEWDGDFRPGKYWMRVRGRDDRDLVGDWSEQLEFEVKVPWPDLVSPKPNETLAFTTPVGSVELEWDAVVDVKKYTVALYDKDKKMIWTQQTAKTSIKAPVPTAAAYTWSVQAIDERGNQSDIQDQKPSFIAQGPAIFKPEVKAPDSAYVRQVELTSPLPQQTTAKIAIERFDDKTQTWVKVTGGQMRKGDHIPFLAKLPGGHYRVSASAQAPMRAPSSTSSVTFDAVDGPRSQSVESRALIRQSIDRTNDWFSRASYVISSVNYDATILQANQSASLNALSSGLNLGLGKFWKDSHYGVYGGADINSLKVSGTEITSPGFEISGLYGIALQRESELRFRVGLFDRTLPQILSVQQTAELKNVSLYGPLAGVEYWYAFSPKFSLQLSGLTRLNAGGTTSYGGSVHSSINYQAGVQAGYRVNKSLTTLAGYSYHHDSIEVNDTNESLNLSGTDQINMSGHYLQLSVEYAF